jgi:fermentation-respiration switch protein FrsA (DUF1100 family)
LVTRAVLMLAAIVVLYSGAGIALFFFQRSLLFVADRTDVAPADAGLPQVQVHRLTASDGVTFVTWLARSEGSRLAIYFHGNGGSLAWRGESIQELMRLGLSVLAMEYRGYGASEGSPSEAGFGRDADTAYDFARKLGYQPSQILLYGESLGTGVAVPLAARREVGGVILDAPFTSIADVAAARYWMFPVRLLLRDPFYSDRAIAKIKAPILMLHGTADEVVPIRFGRRLFALAGSNATFAEIEGGEHVVLEDEGSRQHLQTWLLKLPPAGD